MAEQPDVSVERVIAASPTDVWALVSDPTRYGDWSPENTGAKWSGDATGPALGAKFRGSNRNGWARWTTVRTVTEYEPERVFSFRSWLGIPIATWSYRLEPIDVDGATHTKLAEHFTTHEPRPIEKMLEIALRMDSRPEFNRAGMEGTLAAVAAELER